MFCKKISFFFLLCNLLFTSVNAYSITASKPFFFDHCKRYSYRSIQSYDTDGIIKRIYSTGLFDDVQIFSDSRSLLCCVKKRPLIHMVNIFGNHKVDIAEIESIVNSLSLNRGSISNPNSLHKLKQLLLDKYIAIGHSSAAITIEQLLLPDSNYVNINIHITEGHRSTIQDIVIRGNEVFSDTELLNLIGFQKSYTWNFWKILFFPIIYSPNVIQLYVDQLTQYYLNHGYLKCKVIVDNLDFTNNGKTVVPHLFIHEGELYTVKNIVLQGQFYFDKELLNSLIAVEKNNIFSYQNVLRSIYDIKQSLYESGFAFATVNPVFNVDDYEKTIDLTFYIDPGEKVYINRINLFGNYNTNDYVYRSETGSTEGALYSQDNLNNSKIKLQRLPFVQDIVIKKRKVESNLLDLNYYINERNANNVSASLGYSQFYKFILTNNLILPNIFGTGKQLSINSSFSAVSQTLNLSYTKCYFSKLKVYRTIAAHIAHQSRHYSPVVGYRLNQYSTSIDYSFPISAFGNLTIGSIIENNDLIQSINGHSSVLNWFMKNHQNQSSFTDILFNMSYIFNSTNHAFFPTSGSIFKILGTFSAPFSDLQWFKFSHSSHFFYSFFNDYVFSIKNIVGYGDGYGKTKYLPFFHNFHGGGWGSIRGFVQNSVGFIDTYIPNNSVDFSETGNVIGGNLNIYSNIDILFPVPSITNTRDIRIGVFFDIGNTYSTHMTRYAEKSNSFINNFYMTDILNLRCSVGVQLHWLLPVGLVSFSLSNPFNHQASDLVQPFQFTLGSAV